MLGYDAVVLAGGRGRRMHDPRKTARTVGGRTLLDRVLDACADATQRIVVGEPTPLAHAVRWTREHPPGGGPVPALRAGLAEVRAAQVAVLAGDLPFLTRYDLDLLCRLSTAPTAGAVLLDDTGREQWLAGVWRTDRLRSALATYEGNSLHGVLSPLHPRPLAVRSTTRPNPWQDCDTETDLATAERQASERRQRSEP